MRRDRCSEEASQAAQVLHYLEELRELQELQYLEAQLRRQLQVEVYLEAQQLVLACLVQHHRASKRHQPSQQAPSLVVEALQFLAAHCLEEVPALSQSPLDRCSARHQHLRIWRTRHKAKLKAVNRSLEELSKIEARQQAQVLVEHLVRRHHLDSVEDHRQVAASSVVLEL